MMHSVLIHEYYSRFDQNAVFVTVDTTLRNNHLDIRAYVRSKVGLPSKTEGVIFTPVPCDVVYFEPERVGVGLLFDSLKAGKHTTPVLSSFEQVERYCSLPHVYMLRSLYAINILLKFITSNYLTPL
jgi:translation initiation factor 3 subunit F